MQRLAAEQVLTQNDIGLAWVPEDLPFGGLKRDAARRILTKTWILDWKDGMTMQSVAVVRSYDAR